MAFQAVPDTAEIVLNYTANGESVANVMAAEKSGGYVLADLEALAAAVDALVTSEFLPLQTAEAAYVNTTVRGLASINDLEAVDATGAADGGDIGTGMSGNVTFAIKKLSGQTGRSARGRLFFIGLPRSVLQVNLNILDGLSVTAITDAVEAMRAGIAATVWSPVIISRFTGGSKRVTGVTFDWIDSVAVDNEVDSQRGRLAG